GGNVPFGVDQVVQPDRFAVHGEFHDGQFDDTIGLRVEARRFHVDDAQRLLQPQVTQFEVPHEVVSRKNTLVTRAERATVARRLYRAGRTRPGATAADLPGTMVDSSKRRRVRTLSA